MDVPRFKLVFVSGQGDYSFPRTDYVEFADNTIVYAPPDCRAALRGVLEEITRWVEAGIQFEFCSSTVVQAAEDTWCLRDVSVFFDSDENVARCSRALNRLIRGCTQLELRRHDFDSRYGDVVQRKYVIAIVVLM